jgi:hypothetical protein
VDRWGLKEGRNGDGIRRKKGEEEEREVKGTEKVELGERGIDEG